MIVVSLNAQISENKNKTLKKKKQFRLLVRLKINQATTNT